MELTPRESKLLDRLRKYETEMYRSRHLLLAVGICSFVVAGTGAVMMVYWSSKRPEIAGVLYTFLFPSLLLVAVNGACILGIAIRDWNGNAVRVLILKLMDEQTGADGEKQECRGPMRMRDT